MNTIVLIVLVSLITACLSVGVYHYLVVRPQAKKQAKERTREERNIDMMRCL